MEPISATATMYFKTEWSSSRPRKSTNPDVLHRQTQPQSKTASRSPRQPQPQPAVGSITNPTHRHPVLGDKGSTPRPTPTSVIGDTPVGRRRRKLQTPKQDPKPPPSATKSWDCRERKSAGRFDPAEPPLSANPETVAEDGGYRPPKQIPNLRHRRPNQPLADDGS